VLDVDEVFPLLGGIVVGLACSQLPAMLSRFMVLLLAVAVGVTASYISGELAADWRFVLIDIGEVLLAAATARMIVGRMSRRRRVVS
jgi:hypothetical protein